MFMISLETLDLFPSGEILASELVEMPSRLWQKYCLSALFFHAVNFNFCAFSFRMPESCIRSMEREPLARAEWTAEPAWA